VLAFHAHTHANTLLPRPGKKRGFVDITRVPNDDQQPPASLDIPKADVHQAQRPQSIDKQVIQNRVFVVTLTAAITDAPTPSPTANPPVTPNGDGENVYTPPPTNNNLDGDADDTKEAPTAAPTAAPTEAPTESVYTPPPDTKPASTRSSSAPTAAAARASDCADSSKAE